MYIAMSPQHIFDIQCELFHIVCFDPSKVSFSLSWKKVCSENTVCFHWSSINVYFAVREKSDKREMIINFLM